MSENGFEALADGSLLLVVLLLASTVVLALGRGPGNAPVVSATDVEATRLALFGTTLDGLSYRVGERDQALRNGTSVESILRLEAHLLRNGSNALDFAAANERIADVAARLVRPGWALSIDGRIAGGGEVMRIGDPPSGDYAWSGWTYPPLDGTGGDTILGVAVAINPHR